MIRPPQIPCFVPPFVPPICPSVLQKAPFGPSFHPPLFTLPTPSLLPAFQWVFNGYLTTAYSPFFITPPPYLCNPLRRADERHTLTRTNHSNRWQNTPHNLHILGVFLLTHSHTRNTHTNTLIYARAYAYMHPHYVPVYTTNKGFNTLPNQRLVHLCCGCFGAL